MRKFGILWLCCLLSFVVVTKGLRAEIKLSGLEQNTVLSDYITEKALEAYKETPDKLVRIAKVKAEINKALKAKGYYGAEITYKNGANHVFNIKAGSVYTIQNIKISGYNDQSALPLQAGEALDAKTVLGAQNKLFKHIAKEECFYNLSVIHEISLNHAAHTAEIAFIVNGQKGATFGTTEFIGADDIKRKHLSRFVKYKKGECWNPTKIEETKTELLQTGLLNTADVELPETLPETKSVPIVFSLKGRAARKVRLGTKYSTSEGPGVSAEWRHNNYFGSGEEVSVMTRVSTLLQSIGLDFTKPFFRSKKQSLNASIKLEREDTDAFEEVSLNVQSSIRRKLSPNWTGNLGVTFETSKITDETGEEETFGLVSLPGRINFDNRDNPLDPHKGYSFGFGVEPFVDAFGQSDPFFKSRITGTTYFDLSQSSYDPVLALRGSLGSILGSDTDSIPASKRFYAGGGGSVRGFGFQEAGPVDDDDDPLGGRSLLETTAELRLKLTDTIGGVAFVDAGGAYDNIVPDFNEGLFIGAGVGARYYTDFGPIRFDVAAPVNKKDHADQGVQIYISIGQAF